MWCNTPIVSRMSQEVSDDGEVDEAEIFFCRTYDTQLTGSFGAGDLVLFGSTHLPAVTSFLHKDSKYNLRKTRFREALPQI